MGYNENVATSDSYAANCILGLYPGAYPGGAQGAQAPPSISRMVIF